MVVGAAAADQPSARQAGVVGKWEVGGLEEGSWRLIYYYQSLVNEIRVFRTLYLAKGFSWILKKTEKFSFS